MSLENIKSKLQSERGFTIVELLIVIVVIGILAAITVVAYTGVTTNARNVQNKTDATAIARAAEAYNADNGDYPMTAAEFTATSNTAKLPANLTPAPTSATVTNRVQADATANPTTPAADTIGTQTWVTFNNTQTGVKYNSIKVCGTSGVGAGVVAYYLEGTTLRNVVAGTCTP
jgi:prepilin-type N-terminal cleavage/methylation domain-containing protein